MKILVRFVNRWIIVGTMFHVFLIFVNFCLTKKVKLPKFKKQKFSFFRKKKIIFFSTNFPIKTHTHSRIARTKITLRRDVNLSHLLGERESKQVQQQKLWNKKKKGKLRCLFKDIILLYFFFCIFYLYFFFGFLKTQQVSLYMCIKAGK